MLGGDFPTLSQSQVRHAQFSNHIGSTCGEESMERRGTFHSFFGKSTPTQEGTTKKSSSALASTLSTCQIPGGTSILVGCVLGKAIVKPKQQIRGSVKRNPGEDRKELLATSPLNNGPTLNGKGRTGILTFPRSISVNGPRIGNLNSPPPSQKFLGTTMTFLFDKVASVTDCRSTGHFVLPKRKVEEHFPPINKPGGIWMTLVDATGKEWSFEFCFWHSKESRIYYFKKFYPYVQSTDLRGGDTVFFSRLEPQGTLFIGYRKQKPPPPKQMKALNCGASKDQFKEREHSNGGLTYLANDWSPSLEEVATRQKKPTKLSADDANVDYALDRGIIQRKKKRKKEFPPLSLAQRTKVIDHLAVGEALIDKKSTSGRSSTPDTFQHDDRIAGVLGSKGKRLRVNADEYAEWKEMQDLLRPAPGALPTVLTIEGHDFEEYEAPPVLITRTYHSPEAHGENQWVKCNDCGSWRRLSADAFVPAGWICSDSDLDQGRAYCNAPQELSDHEIHQLLGLGLDAEGRTETQEDLNEDGDWTTPEHLYSAQADVCAYKQPTLWSAAMALVDGSLHRGTESYSELKSCESDTSVPEFTDHGPGMALQSPRLKQFCDLIEDSSSRRSTFLETRGRKVYENPTDSDEFVDPAGAAKGYEIPRADCYDFLGPVGKVLTPRSEIQPVTQHPLTTM
ncbi:B3 domain-containing protein Os07g0679700 isoform X2 [Physcomitrium patens]|uniref:CW-type domain-containing protein n=1 Tax=Physcomitrium patens TaxID=3218 RepID=A0A7I4DLS7_PHYPA|nr:B3 domain-containing protein Os07g0563300-like isoform X2 [Physcomitrium patens]|eukprot:XP_024372600.1 B3 domain-containing protein Os07g0563300-like isoform X2 [Physcomitrella patens]